MRLIAWRNLFHDRVRLVVTLTGIIFAIVLIIVQLGLFLGFTRTTSVIADHAGADIWISAHGLRNFDTAAAIPESKLYQAMATPGVAVAQKAILGFSTWKRRDGSQESIEVVGINPEVPLATPWSLIEGRVEDLKAEDTVIIDQFYKSKLDIDHIGQTIEINNRRARVVGYTTGVRSFTTSPYVFTWFKNAQNYSRLRADQIHYILIKGEPGVALPELKQRLKDRIADVDVYLTPEISKLTQNYWMFTTGAGIAIIIAAAMGLVVGIVVVAQTIYASTVDHIREFGTLKAMGATNGYIFRIIVMQAAISGTIGYALGITVAYFVIRGATRGGANILLTPELAVTMFFVSLGMCIGASLVSINKVTSIDPAMVFKG